jgi:CMP-N,N'-diacetyllegionaminic acid synthase
MYKGKSFVVVIPAKAKSFLKGKNLRIINGIHMLGYPIIAAKASSLVDRVIVSSEDPNIQGVARFYGAETPFTRPRKLAEAHATSTDVLINAEEEMARRGVKWDYTIFMQCTTPLVSTEDINNCIKIHIGYPDEPIFSKKGDSTVSMCISPIKLNWLFEGSTRTVLGEERGTLSSVLPVKPINPNLINIDRQFLEDHYIPNGAIYINAYGAGQVFGQNIVAYIMPRERSIDVDEEFDLIIAEAVAKHLKEKTSNLDVA